jgi:hypothetical protein
MTAASSPLWEIDRLELVFFDAEFSRWQLFQEDPGLSSPSKGHRAQIQDVLGTLRNVLTHLPDGTPFTVAETPRNAPVRIDIKQAEWQRLGSDASSAWPDFVAALIEGAQKDGLISNQESPDTCPSSQTPLSIGELLTNGLCPWPAMLADGNIECLITASAARDLISLLPVLAHWDLYGALHHGWLPFLRQKRSESLWQAAGQCRMPFYCSHLIYLRGSNADAALKSKQLLGYSAAVEAIFTDLANSDRQPVPIALREYYEYAFYPKDTKEALLYRFYALLLDKLQIALAGLPEANPALAQPLDTTATAPKAAQDAQAPKPEHLYYLAYPIFSGLGRRHFLHVYASPHKGNPAVTELWTAWEQLHRQLDWRELQHALIDELEQVEATRFQSHMNRAMSERAGKNARLQYQDAVPESVAANLHLLMPLQDAGLKINGQYYAKSWTYLPLISKVSELPLGLKWTTEDKQLQEDNPFHLWPYPHEPVAGAPKPVRLTLIWTDPQLFFETSVQKTLAADRRRRLVAQQERFATTLWDAKAAERAAAKKGAEEDREDRRAALTGQRVRLLNELSTTPGSLVEKFNRIQIEFHSKPESAKDFFRKHFYLEGLDPDGPDPEAAWKSALQEVSKSSLHLLISEYIETGVVRWLTHPFTETLDTEFAVETIRTAHADVCGRVRLALNAQDDTTYSALQQHFSGFATAVENYIGTITAVRTTLRTLQSGPPNHAGGGPLCSCPICKAVTIARTKNFRLKLEEIDASRWRTLLGVDVHSATTQGCVDKSAYLNIIVDRFGIDETTWSDGLPKWLNGARPVVTAFSRSIPTPPITSPFHSRPARLFRHSIVLAKDSLNSPVNLASPPSALLHLGKVFSPIGSAAFLTFDEAGEPVLFCLFPHFTRLVLEDVLAQCLRYCAGAVASSSKEAVILSIDRYYV